MFQKEVGEKIIGIISVLKLWQIIYPFLIIGLILFQNF